MLGFLITIHTLVSILLVTFILMQASQGGGLAGSFGGQASNTLLGARGAASLLTKITTWLAIIFMALAILISLVGTTVTTGTGSSVLQDAVEEQSLSPGADLSSPGIPVNKGQDQ